MPLRRERVLCLIFHVRFRELGGAPYEEKTQPTNERKTQPNRSIMVGTLIAEDASYYHEVTVESCSSNSSSSSNN
jgi:hypothetical protein